MKYALSRRRFAPDRDRRRSALDLEERKAAIRASLETETPILQLRGYATVFERVASIPHYGRLEYAASAFAADLCVPLVIDHNMRSKVSPSNRVAISRDPKGLFMVCDIHADTAGRATLNAYLLGRKSLSVAAKPITKISRKSRGGNVTRVLGAQLLEISMVDHGAFQGTEATLYVLNGRSFEDAVARVRDGATRKE